VSVAIADLIGRIKLLTGELKSISGDVNSNGRLRMYVDPVFLLQNDIDFSAVDTLPSIMWIT